MNIQGYRFKNKFTFKTFFLIEVIVTILFWNWHSLLSRPAPFHLSFSIQFRDMNGLAESSFDADPASLSQLLVLQKMISNLAMWIEIVCLKSSLQVNFPSFNSPDYKILTCRFLGPLLTSLLPTPPEVGTLVMWISRSMLDLNLLLFYRDFTRYPVMENVQLIRSQEIFPTNERTEKYSKLRDQGDST